jgi:hypothetical protein
MRTIVLAAIGTINLAMTVPAGAADLVIGGRVVRLSNTGNNSTLFSIEVAGGSTNLCGSSWIHFPASAAGDAEIHKRAYAAALVALTTGMPVRVYNYQSNSCDAAAYIELSAS